MTGSLKKLRYKMQFLKSKWYMELQDWEIKIVYSFKHTCQFS